MSIDNFLRQSSTKLSIDSEPDPESEPLPSAIVYFEERIKKVNISNRKVTDYTDNITTVGSDTKENFIVFISPNSNRPEAYFNIGNSGGCWINSTKAATVSFKSPPKQILTCYDEMEYWMIKWSELRPVVEWLQEKPKSSRLGQFSTNWEKAIYLWNYESDFTDHPDWDDSCPMGCRSSSRLLDDPRFVPMNTEMPDYKQMYHR